MKREVKIGILTLVTLAVFIIGFTFLKGGSVFSGSKTYYAIYEDVEGLYPGDAVLINGVRVGKVDSRELKNDGSGDVIVVLQVDKDLLIPENSLAILYSADLFGEKAVKILPGDSEKMLESDQYINTKIDAGIVAKFGSEIQPLTERLNGLVGQVDSLTYGINKLFDENNPNGIHAIMADLKSTSTNLVGITAALDNQLNNQGSSLNMSLSNIQSITGNLKQNNEELTSMITNLSQLSEDLNNGDITETINNAKIAMNEVNILLDAINNGDGNINSLVYDKDIYENLKASTKNLEVLIDDIYENPSKYISVQFSVFPKKDKKKKNKDEDGE